MKTKSKKVTISSLITLMVICLVLTGVFLFAPIEAHAEYCNVGGCQGSFSEHGICDDGGHYQPATLNGGVYEISNYGQFLWFAEQVNSGVGVSYNAKLTNDIAFSYRTNIGTGMRPQLVTIYRDFVQVGTSLSASYRGTFDGNGFALTGIKIDDATLSNVGVFGYLNGGTVKNLEVTGLSLNGNQYVGGLVGYSMNGTIENVMTGGTVKGVDSVGGIVGYADSTTVKNSWSNATLTATTNKGGIVGQVFSTTSNIENCYYLNTKADVGFNGDAANGVAEAKTSAQFSSGEVTYLLGESWGQNIDNGSAVQSTPQLFSEARTYKALSCEGDGTVVYTNNSSVNENSQTHLWNTSGFCRTNDSHYQPAKMTTDQHDVDGDGNTDSVYEIANVGNLFWFAGHLAAGNGDCNAILMNNLTVNTGTVTEDGSSLRKWVTSGEFNGIFEGNGKTISGLWSDVGGLFTTNYGTIRNLGVKNSYISQTTFASLGTIANGNAATGKIENCFSEATVVGVDGIDVDVYESVSFTGGIVGSNLGTVQNCYNTGAVTAQGYVGGIAGGLSANSVISACYNTGAVTATKNTGYAGGIVGSTAGASGDAVIKDCYNLGSVTANQYAGGIFGRRINVSTYISNCYNLGDITAVSSYGPITGESSTDNVTNCYYDGIDFVNASSSGHLEYKTTEAFASGEVAYLLGSAWGQNIDIGTAQSYPVLGGKAVYQNNEADAYCDAYVYSNTDTDIFPTKHYYDTTTGICSHCEHQGEARLAGVVYNTFEEAIAAIPDQEVGGSSVTVYNVYVMTDIYLGSSNIELNNKRAVIRGINDSIVIEGSGSPMFLISNSSHITFTDVTLWNLYESTGVLTNGNSSAIKMEPGTTVIISASALIDTKDSELSTAILMEDATLYMRGAIDSYNNGIRYQTKTTSTSKNIIRLEGGEIFANENAVQGYTPRIVGVSYGDAKATIIIGSGSYDLPTINDPISLTSSSSIQVGKNLSGKTYTVIGKTVTPFAYAEDSTVTLDRTWFTTDDETMYVQKNTDGDLYINTCDHNELSYKKTGTYKVTETCAVCGGANEVELHAPENLVYSASAKQATVTGSFFHSAPSAITYCCEGGCKNVLNGKTHTATVTVGSYTLTKNFVIQKAPGTASVTIQGWKLGDDPNAPVPSSQTNGANGITYYYKLADADDSTYTTTVPTAEGQYILKAVFAAADNYEEVTAYANFAIGKEMPEYTVPTGLTATYGDLLSTVALPEGWSWKDGEQTVGNAGTNEFVAVFTPEDTDTYLSPEVLVQVEVAKANVPIFTLSQTEFTYVEGMVLDFRAYLSGGYDGANVILPIRTTEGTTYDYTFDYNNGVISKMTEAGITFRLYVQVNSTENYNRYLEYFTVTIHKGTQNFTVSPSIQSPTIVDEVQLIASGNAGAVTYTTTDQYLSVNGDVLTATRVGKRTITATAAETDLYEAATKTVEVTYYLATGDKAPDYAKPTNLTVCVGHSAYDIELPEGWEWTSDVEFTTVKSYTVTARFTPEDTVNFNPANVNLTVVVTGHTGGTAASCTTDQVCTECGEVLVEALGHDLDDATCDAPKTCSVCGETEGEALGHDWNDATCETPKTCSVCGETEGNALGHTDASPKDHICDNGCGKTNMGAHSDSTDSDHLCDYGCGEVADEGCYDTAVDGKCDECGADIDHECGGGTADCTNPAHCSICGQSYGTALGHDMSDATCTEASKCRREGCNYTEGSALGHTGGTATCTEEKICTRCGSPYGGVTGHADADFNHTCDNGCGKTDMGAHSDGNDTNHLCDYGCNQVADDGCYDTNPLDGKCDECGLAVDHECIGGTADCTNPANCSICGQPHGNALGHDWDDATCDAPKTCSVCGETEGEALGHDWDDATCETPKTCSVCGETEGNALGHTDVAPKDHICDNGCGRTDMGTHSDGSDSDHLCDYGCGVIADEGCYDTVVDGLCDECGADINHTCVDVNEKDHACDICSAPMGEHEDSATDTDHVCDYGCGATLEACSGGNATCTAQAVCTICGQPYGELEAHDFAPATCDVPSTCRNCPETTGVALGHLDENTDHVCDRNCGVTNIGEHTDGDDDNHLCDYGCGQVADEGCYDSDPVDGNCDECGVAVDHKHTGGSATCTTKAVCTICGQPYGELANHSAEAEWQKNDTHHWYECTGCDDQELDKAAHNDGNNDGSCDACGYAMSVTPPPHNHSFGTNWVTDANNHWKECECEEKSELGAHVDGNNDGACDTCAYAMSVTPPPHNHSFGTNWVTDANNHWKECECEEKSELGAHVDGNNDGACDTCAYAMSVAPPPHTHSHGSTWVTDANEHWNECECGDKANKAAHVDDNGDNKCDTCDYTMPAHDPDTPDDPNNTPEDPSGDDEGGLGTGAIIAIVAASVVALGGGGFALYWFVIRKKRVI